MNLEKLLNTQKQIRVLGIDDSHHAEVRGSIANVAGVLCQGTRFEGMIWNELTVDGNDATEKLIKMVSVSKYKRQLHLVLLDGITFGGCNVVDLPVLADAFEIPVVAVMRKKPNLKQFRHVFTRFEDFDERWRKVEAAGPIHEAEEQVFQCVGESPSIIARALDRLTDTGKVPEALRLAHLIGSAVKLGQSAKRA